MKASYHLENFINSQLSSQGRPYSRDELDECVDSLKKITSTIQSGTECYLQEKDALKFSILFFLLLEKNCPPIPLSPEVAPGILSTINSQKIRAHISHGEVLKAGTPNTQTISDTPYYICLTSGSTGTPKECRLTLKGAIENAAEHANSLGITKNHMILQNLPLYHSFGIVAFLMVTAIHKCALDFCPIFLTPKNMLKRTWSNSVLHCSPSQLNFMLKDKDCVVNGVSIISFGAGVVSSDNVLKLKNIFPDARFYATYGLTELGPRVTTGEITQVMDAGYVGSSFKQIETRVVNSNLQISEHGIGFLAIKSPSLKQNVEPHELICDGDLEFYLTKDQVKILPNGEIYFLSRSDDLIKVGGISVYTIDIENVAKRFVGIEDAIALPMPHPIYGDVPVLFIEGNIQMREFEEHLVAELTTYQMPKKIHVVEKFPRISINKIDRNKLKEDYFGK